MTYNTVLVLIDLSPFIAYIAAFYAGIRAAIDLRRARNVHPMLLSTMKTMITFSNLLTLSYTVLQIAWTLHERWEAFDFAENLGWLVHDWLNALAHLSFAVLISTYVKFRENETEFKSGCGGRRSDCAEALKLSIEKNRY